MASREDERKRNPILLNQLGVEVVQDIMSRTQEMFQHLKVMQLPNGTPTGTRNSQERFNKVKECLETIEKLFSKLKLVYAELQKRPIAIDEISSLVPLLHLKENDEQEKEKPAKTQKEQMLENKKKELESQLQIRNQQLEKILLVMRKIVWDMNAVSSCMGIL